MSRRDPFQEFWTDCLTLCRQDGTVQTNIKASVQKTRIVIPDEMLRIGSGDTLKRSLRNGTTEEFIVEQANFAAGIEPIPAHWSIQCHHKNRLPVETTGVTYNVSGPNSRVNIHSFDSSTNSVQADAPDIFAKCVDATALAIELSTLRAELVKTAHDRDHYLAIIAVSDAEAAAKEGQTSIALKALAKGGQWALDVATKLGISLATDALKIAMGLK
jgi:hypothetical protein